MHLGTAHNELRTRGTYCNVFHKISLMADESVKTIEIQKYTSTEFLCRSKFNHICENHRWEFQTIKCDEIPICEKSALYFWFNCGWYRFRQSMSVRSLQQNCRRSRGGGGQFTWIEAWQGETQGERTWRTLAGRRLAAGHELEQRLCLQSPWEIYIIMALYWHHKRKVQT